MEIASLDSRFKVAPGAESSVVEPVATAADAVAHSKKVAAALAKAGLGGGSAVAGGASSAAVADASPAVDGSGAPIGDATEQMSPEERKKAERKARKAAAAAAKAKLAKEKAAAKAARSAEFEKKKSSKGKPKRVEAKKFENTTPDGEKKDCAQPLMDSYYPQAVECAWGSWWDKKGFFKPDVEAAAAAGEEGRFVMVIPPPNVTGTLHLGHALTESVEDAITRWNRMCGKPTLWLPGTDHAGIATQAVVEKRLYKEEGKTRHDLGREEFLKRVWEWKETYGGRITNQLRKLGVSVDWTRERFTMDDQCSKAVTEAFVQMFNDGIIYRSTRLVNWCPKLHTAISDIEVDYIDIEKPIRRAVPNHDPAKKYEFGTITSFAYEIIGQEGELVVATTRLETMLGDVAVAVHPEDPRYKHLHGAKLQHPFADRQLVVITDAELVDMEFGTGAVKITPAHDPNDYACGKRHSLPMITVFDDDGKINAEGGEFEGLMRYDAREAVEKALEAKGLLRGKAPNAMRLGLCSRSGDVIEPMLKPQWWVDCNDLAARAVKAVEDGELQILPEFHKATWYGWLRNIQPWCISRQLWWGHRIPAYMVKIDGNSVGSVHDTKSYVVGHSEADALAKAATIHGVDASRITLEQDPDVLDTWFSSGLFPFSTMGWPDKSAKDLDAFFPNSLLETGHDILFFWVARMVMMSLHLMGKLPFKKVYLHAMVRDKTGRKMSKSLGNVIDPLEVIYGCNLDALHSKIRASNLPEKEIVKAIEGQKLDFPDGIPECGADALRFGLLAYTQQGRDVNLDINVVIKFRQFCNKLWNATKFAMMNLKGYTHTMPLHDIAAMVADPASPLAPRDRWVISRLDACIEEVNSAMANYMFSDACTAAHRFWQQELCDYYLEFVKPVMYGDDAEAKNIAQTVLLFCLDVGLRLLHPMMPFVTEELWQHLPCRGAPWDKAGAFPDPESICIAPFPQPMGARNAEVEERTALVQQLIYGARVIRSDANVTKPAEFYVVARSQADLDALAPQADDFATLVKANKLHTIVGGAAPAGCSVNVVSESFSVYMNLRGLIDTKAEIAKLQKKLKKVDKDIATMNKRMSAATYESKVPAAVRATNAEHLDNLTKQRGVILASIEDFQKMEA
jgi:valyl-tRNA synthetase